MRIKVWISVLVLFSLLASCNLPIGQTPATQPPEEQPVSADVDTVGTSVALTMAAQQPQQPGSDHPVSVTETFTPSPTFTFTPTLTFTPTQCVALVTATVTANVRNGPATAYDIVGSLSIGQTAVVAGRNDVNTWWNIEYPAGTGRFAWIAGSVVTATCLPAVVQVVAAPPLPTAEPTEVTASDSGGSGAAGRDLVPVGMSVSANAKKNIPVQVSVGVKNQGENRAGHFTVQWRHINENVGCDWRVNGLEPGESVNLTCTFTYQSCSTYTISMVIDTAGEVVESNEGNNSMSRKLPVSCP